MHPADHAAVPGAAASGLTLSTMDEADLLSRIAALVDEERTLREQHTGEPLDDDDHARLRALEEQLDQCWDLLRQRRARAEYGESADAAQARPVDDVEGYLQ